MSIRVPSESRRPRIVCRLEPRRDVNLHAATRELCRRVLAEPGGDLGEDLRRRVDEHPALRRRSETGVVAQRVPHEVGELGECLDARIAGADEDEREMAGLLLLRGCRVRGLELPEHMVAKRDRVGEVAKAVPVLGQTGNGQDARDRAEREYQVLVADLDGAVDCVDGRHLASRVEGSHAPDHELGVTAHHPKRNDDMARLERSGRCLREQRREQHVVLRADDRGAAAAEPARDDRAGVAAAGDERPAQGPPLHGRTVSAEPVRHARQDHPRLEQQESLDVQRALVVQEALRAAEDELRHHDHGDRVRIGRDSP